MTIDLAGMEFARAVEAWRKVMTGLNMPFTVLTLHKEAIAAAIEAYDSPELRRLRSERECVRAETIEECAKVADAIGSSQEHSDYSLGASDAARLIASRIRSLSAPQAQGGST